jgi:hypothetical protein
MFIHKRTLSSLLLLLAVLLSCTKQKGFGPKSDAIPGNAVVVQNATDYRPDPTVTTSITGGGNIQIVLSIAAGSKRTIKEITKVATFTSYTLIQRTDTTFYNSAPIASNGATATFTTSLTEYFTKNPVTKDNLAAKKDTELSFRFYFLITLDDNTTIITPGVRILVLT